jgi:DnaD/phage-associated family protein
MQMKLSQTFSGFPTGRIDTTLIPNTFFTELLPTIDHLGELKITLYAFWALGKKDGTFRYLQKTEMEQDRVLLSAFKEPGYTPLESLEDGLERAVARGTLLKVTLSFSQGEEIFYFLNTEKGRTAIKAIEDGNWEPSGDSGAPILLEVELPNVFTLYEQNIGPLTPMIADILRDVEATYPQSWIEEAMEIAVQNNVRKWSYINAILEDWKNRGKDAREDRGDTEKARRRYLKGWFDD